MRRAAAAAALIWLAAAPAIAAAAAAVRASPVRPAATASLCRVDERPLFVCPLGRKLAAVCAGAGTATYRFGRVGHAELQATGLGFAERMYSGGGEAQISFARNGYRYVLYDRTVRTGFDAEGHNDPQTTRGLIVRHGDSIRSSAACREAGTVGIAAETASRIPPGSFVPH